MPTQNAAPPYLIDSDDEGDSGEEITGFSAPTRPRLTSPDKFRYKLLRGPWDTPGEFVRLLNGFGKQGWEVIHTQYRDDRPSEVLLKMWLELDDAA